MHVCRTRFVIEATEDKKSLTRNSRRKRSTVTDYRGKLDVALQKAQKIGPRGSQSPEPRWVR